MQAADGGVYHKMTTQDFPLLTVAPQNDNSPLMVMWKTTAATLDFAAVMAVASRIYSPFDATYADKMLEAAKKAWTWAKNNPDVCYNRSGYSGSNSYLNISSSCTNKSNDPTKTGAYEDDNVNDEFFFAAVALATVTDATEQTSLGLFTQMDQSLNANKQTWNPTGYFSEAASWQIVGTLGSYEIIRNKDKFPAKYYNDALDVLTGNSDWMLGEYENGYGLPFGNIFWWGSNSNIANTGILFMELYEATQDIKYKNAAQATFDYILGRNPLDLSYVTGYGNKRPTHIHDRMTESWSWGIFPGQVVGGASSNGCTGEDNFTTALATRYEDKDGCYGYNEIAINWNAPLAYLSAALSEPGDDIDKIELVTKIDDFANGSSNGITEDEYWFNIIVGAAHIDNLSKEGGELINSEGYAELVGISLPKVNNWATDWSQATIVLQTTNNGILYDLVQCSEGFRYEYKGNAHYFSLESGVTYYYAAAFKNDWYPVTVRYSNVKGSASVDGTPTDKYGDFIRDPHDGGSKNIPLDLNKVNEIHWTVRPSDAAVVTGYLQIKDFECLGLLTVFENAAEKTCLDAGKVWENGVCKTPTTYIHLPQIASTRNILAHTTGDYIVLSNLPKNAKLQVYNLQGKQIYSAHSENSQILKIPVQTKGMYIVKAGNQMVRVAVK
jgi:hypothetical protein